MPHKQSKKGKQEATAEGSNGERNQGKNGKKQRHSKSVAVEIFKGQGRVGKNPTRWYWRMLGAKGLTLADSSQGFSTSQNCTRGVRALVKSLGGDGKKLSVRRLDPL